MFHLRDSTMATSKAKSNHPALVPANVPGMVRELPRLASVSNAATPPQKRSDGGRSLFVRGK
jgi:hypothetical protein